MSKLTKFELLAAIINPVKDWTDEFCKKVWESEDVNMGQNLKRKRNAIKKRLHIH